MYKIACIYELPEGTAVSIFDRIHHLNTYSFDKVPSEKVVSKIVEMHPDLDLIIDYTK